MKRLFLFLLAVLVAVVGCWEVYTLSKMPGTSREVRFFGYGSRPDVCVARLQRNFGGLEGPLEQVRTVFADVPELESINFGIDASGDKWVDVATINNRVHRPIYDASELSAPQATLLNQAGHALLDSRNVYQPWSISRNLERPGLVAETFSFCGFSALEWVAFQLYVLRGGWQEPGRAAAPMVFEAREEDGVAGDGACGSQIPELVDFTGKCSSPIQGSWFVVMHWWDQCGSMNALGFPEDDDPMYQSPADQEYLRELKASGKTPCEVYLH